MDKWAKLKDFLLHTDIVEFTVSDLITIMEIFEEVESR
ncbi:MAG: hypothetical protein DDT19_01715 [Syntrophomonadaceae bacterium]|nr:hypothetical protein [Bacillota bacterium]